MALMERFFDIYPTGLNFFDALFHDAAAEMAQMEHEMDLMRRRMFHLLPHDNFEVASAITPAAAVQLQPLAPIVMGEDGKAKLKLEFNVKDFKPEEVKLKVVGENTLQVRAEHEEKNEKGEVSKRLYVRQYKLPKGVEVANIKPTLSKDGVLTVEAPAPGLVPSERLIPIEFKEDNHPQ